MAIVASDIVFKLSGGAANSDPNASLGGARSSVTMGTGIGNLFDNVSGAESTSGDTEYRCFYVLNTHATLTMQSAVIFILSNTPSTSSAVRIAVGTSAVNGTEQTVADESTVPSGVTWSTAANAGASLALGDIPAGQHRAVWVERVISVGAAAYNDDQCTLQVNCDTAA